MPKVLIVNDAGDSNVSAPHFDDATMVVETDSTGNAIELLADQEFDALYVCDSQQGNQALKRILQSDSILDCIPFGVALLDSQKRIARANRRLLEAFDAMQDSEASADSGATNFTGKPFYDCLGETSIVGDDPSPLSSAMATKTAVKATLKVGDRYFSMYATPVLNSAGVCEQMVVTLRESTMLVIQRQKLDALHQAGSELTDLRPEEIYQMGFEERIELLKQNILHYTEDLLNFDVVEIRVLNAETSELRPLLSVGMDSGITQRTLFASRADNGVTGFVAATGKSYLCEDTTDDDLYMDGLMGAKSSLTVPLKYHDEIVGTFNVESPETNRFTKHDVTFLESFARYIAIALNTLELLNAQRTDAALQSVSAIRNAVGMPVDEILNHTVQSIESFIGQDPEVIERLETVLEHARAIKRAICNIESEMAPDSLLPTCVQIQPRPALKEKRVLVIDGDENVRTSAHHLLERYGCVVETAHTGREAMMMVRRRSCKTGDYDALIADIRLPDIKGYELLVELKQFYGDPPLILMTGYGYDPCHTVPKAREEGLRTNAVLYKPFRLEQLLEILEATVTRDAKPLAT